MVFGLFQHSPYPKSCWHIFGTWKYPVFGEINNLKTISKKHLNVLPKKRHSLNIGSPNPEVFQPLPSRCPVPSDLIRHVAPVTNWPSRWWPTRSFHSLCAPRKKVMEFFQVMGLAKWSLSHEFHDYFSYRMYIMGWLWNLNELFFMTCHGIYMNWYDHFIPSMDMTWYDMIWAFFIGFNEMIMGSTLR